MEDMNRNCEDIDLDKLVHDAMKNDGLLLPTTKEEVEREEARQEEETISIPESLKDPFKILERNQPPILNKRIITDKKADEGLARAAREGGDILPEIEEKMRRDREEAEKKLKK